MHQDKMGRLELKRSLERGHKICTFWQSVLGGPLYILKTGRAHLLTHVAIAGSSREPNITPFYKFNKTTSSKFTGLSSAQYLNTSWALSFQLCKWSSATLQVQRIFHIILHPNFNAQLFSKQLKQLEHCKDNSRAIIKEQMEILRTWLFLCFFAPLRTVNILSSVPGRSIGISHV